MKKKPENQPKPSGFPNPPELPSDLLEPDLRRLDARLTHELRDVSIPPGLADRVFEASAGHLTPLRLQPLPMEGEGSMRLVHVRRQRWGRMAMAASLFLVVGVSWNLMNQSSSPNANQHAGLVTPAKPLLVPPLDSIYEFDNALALSVDTEYMLLTAVSTSRENDLSYLALTKGITLHDIEDDFLNLLSDLNEERGFE